MARGGDDYVMFRDIEPVLPVADLPTLAAGEPAPTSGLGF